MLIGWKHLPIMHADLQRYMLLRHETLNLRLAPILGSGELPLHLIAEFGPGGAPGNLSRVRWKLMNPANRFNALLRA